MAACVRMYEECDVELALGYLAQGPTVRHDDPSPAIGAL
jgi:hypothetical protein